MDLCDIKNIDSWPFPRFLTAADVSLPDHHRFGINGDASFSGCNDFRGRSYINICSWSLLCTKPMTSTTRRMWEFHGERLGLPSYFAFFSGSNSPVINDPGRQWRAVATTVVIMLAGPYCCYPNMPQTDNLACFWWKHPYCIIRTRRGCSQHLFRTNAHCE